MDNGGIKPMAKERTNSRWKDARTYFIGLLLLSMVALVIQLFIIDMLPMKYFAIIVVVLLVLFGLMWLLQYAKGINKLNRTLGKIMIVLLSGLLIFANIYAFIGGNTLGVITGDKENITEISVVVLKNDTAQKLSDLEDDAFGVLNIDRDNTNYAVDKIKKDLHDEISTIGYTNINDMANALYQGEARAIVLNESYRSMIEEESYPDFSDETKVIKRYKRVTKAKSNQKKVSDTNEAFNVLITGNDRYGSINTGSRSDVNIIMTVNPNTKTILMTSIPRDYYVRIPCYENEYDKLTHAGNGGALCSAQTLEQKFGIDINYYLRVNFSSLIDIVDVLGGIDVQVTNSFSDGTYQFIAGVQHMDGAMALAFSRDRYHQADGDRDRGKNQMLVIDAIIDKAISPSIITNYTNMMSVVSGSFETNMESDDITDLVKMQLDEMSGWNMIHQSVDGSGDTRYSYQNGFNSYVMIPNEESVAAAIQQINAVMSGN